MTGRGHKQWAMLVYEGQQKSAEFVVTLERGKQYACVSEQLINTVAPVLSGHPWGMANTEYTPNTKSLS